MIQVTLSFLVAIEIRLNFRMVQCCGGWHGCARSPALSLPMEYTHRCPLVMLLYMAVSWVVVWGGTILRCLPDQGGFHLAASCVLTRMCIWGAGYSSISSRAHRLAVDVIDTTLRCLARLCPLLMLVACNTPSWTSLSCWIRLYSVYFLFTAVSRMYIVRLL